MLVFIVIKKHKQRYAHQQQKENEIKIDADKKKNIAHKRLFYPVLAENFKSLF